ncbi:MAG: outer membrane lipoprotein-sorting protein [Nitrospinae bacterium]|nr:outer membrane lipoprotein-sorting protein [Nitrospinota bacterium]
MRAFVQWVTKHRAAVIAFTILVTLGLLFQLKNLAIVIDPAKILPQSHPMVVAGNRVEELFGNKHTVVVGIHARQGEALTPAILGKAQRITRALVGAKGVVRNNVVSLAARKAKDIKGTEEGLEVRQLMERVPVDDAQMAALKEAIAANPLYENLVVSADRSTISVVAEFKDGPGGFTGITDTVRGVIAPEMDGSVEITFAGGPVFNALIEKYSARMGFFFPLALLIIALVLYEAFCGVQALVLPLVTALMAVIWSLGVMGLSGVELDPFNATTPILILAVAAGHAVQIMKRYYEEYHRIRETSPALAPQTANQLAVIASIEKVGPVMLAAGTIAAMGFFSLMIFDIKSIQTFGIFTGSGIVCAMLLELTFIPALRSSLKAPGERERMRESKHTWLDVLAKRAAGAVLDKRGMLFAAAAALIALFAFGGTLVRMDNSTKGMFYGSLPEMKDDDAYNRRMAGANAAFILVSGKEDDAIKNPAVLKGMETLQRELEKDPMVGKTLSIADYIKRINKAMNGDNPSFDRIPDSRELIAQYLLLYSTSGEPGDFDSVVDYGYRNASIAVFLKTDSSAYAAALADKVQRLSAQLFGPEVTVSAGGGVTNGAALNEVLVREKILNIIQIAAVVFVISSMIFRSLLAGLLVLVPLTVTVAANFGIMGLLGIPLEVATSTISAMAVGIGADYAIYLAYRLKEELAGGADERTAVYKAFGSAGKAVLLVALSVAAGYSVLMFSYGFSIHFWLGLLISLAMLASAIASVTLFPALILALRPRFIFGEAAAPAAPNAALTAGALALLFAASFFATPAHAAELSAAEIMKLNFAVSKVADSTTDSTFRLINANGQERVRKTEGKTKLIPGAGDEMRVVRFLAPPDVKGTATLMIEHGAGDDDLWIYLPALKKVRRLVSSNKKDSFVGTDFSYGDVMGHKVEDWTHKILRAETVDGVECHVIESLPARPSVAEDSGYSKRIGWIRKDNMVTIKGEMYDQGGELLKTFKADDVTLVDAAKGKWQAMRLEAHNAQSGHRTIITFENYRANAGVKESVFTTRYLEKEN